MAWQRRREHLPKWHGNRQSAILIMNHNIHIQMQSILRANELMALSNEDARYECPEELVDARDAIVEIFKAPMPRAKLIQNRCYLEAI